MKAADVHIAIIRPSKKTKAPCGNKKKTVTLQRVKFTDQNCFTFIFFILDLSKKLRSNSFLKYYPLGRSLWDGIGCFLLMTILQSLSVSVSVLQLASCDSTTDEAGRTSWPFAEMVFQPYLTFPRECVVFSMSNAMF